MEDTTHQGYREGVTLDPTLTIKTILEKQIIYPCYLISLLEAQIMDKSFESDDNARLLMRSQSSRRKRPTRDGMTGEMDNAKSAEASPPPRASVIRRAPPAAPPEQPPPSKRRRTEGSPTGVILIRDAIMYRIVDILLWKVLGEKQLESHGYPLASTHQILWRAVRRGGDGRQEPTCAGNLNCFASHVYQFLGMCAPNLWTRTGWGKLSIEDVLRRIYYEDLVPYLRSVDLRNSLTVLQCHSDIVLLEKWERQQFTAVTWSGEKPFSQVTVDCPRCPQCSNRHF